MQRLPALLLSAALVSLCAFPAPAQKFIPKTIQFKGDAEYSDTELLEASGLKPGLVLTSAEMNDHSKLLMDSGVFDNLTYKFDGQDLVFQLTPATLLYPIRLENLPLAPGAELDRKLHNRLPLYHGKVPQEGTLLDAVRKELEAMLAEQGIAASVSAVAYSDRKGGPRAAATAMTFGIADKPVQVGAVHLEGASPAFSARIEALAVEAGKNPFDTENSAANIERSFTNFYQDEGYAAVKVVATRAGAPVTTPEAIQIPYSVTVEEGRLYKLDGIHLPKDAPMDPSEIERASHDDHGTKVRGVGLRTVWSLLSSRYKSKGYLDCKLTPQAHIDEAAGTVNYTVDVVTGPVYHLAFVKFDNVSDGLRALLMKNWQLMPGDPFDENYVAMFVLKAQQQDPVLRQTLAGIAAKYDVRADPQTHEVNVVMRLEKRP